MWCYSQITIAIATVAFSLKRQHSETFTHACNKYQTAHVCCVCVCMWCACACARTCVVCVCVCACVCLSQTHTQTQTRARAHTHTHTHTHTRTHNTHAQTLYVCVCAYHRPLPVCACRYVLYSWVYCTNRTYKPQACYPYKHSHPVYCMCLLPKHTKPHLLI